MIPFLREIHAQRWTKGKNDPCNYPSVNSCLLRIPESVNSKNNKKVEIIQEWNNIRPAANQLLIDFNIKMAARKLACRSKQREFYFYPSVYLKKNYSHFGHVTKTNFTVTAIEGISWIENLLNCAEGIADGRKIMVDLVIAPYLVNTKRYGYDTAHSKITEWLDKCGRKRKLDFNSRYKVSYALRRALKTRIKPMKLETMKNDYRSMYDKITHRQN